MLNIYKRSERARRGWITRLKRERDHLQDLIEKYGEVPEFMEDDLTERVREKTVEELDEKIERQRRRLKEFRRKDKPDLSKQV